MTEMTPEDRAVVEEQFAYIRSRPPSKHPLAGLMLDEKLELVENYRLNIGTLPKPVEEELRRLRAEHADDPEVLDAILEMQWRDRPHDRARRVQAARIEKVRARMMQREFNQLQLEAAHRGFLWRDERWVHVDDLRPKGIKNRYAR